MFLVVFCLCVLVVFIFFGFFGGIGGVLKNGILVKGGNYFEVLNDVEMVVFDKIGIFMKGVFKVIEIKLENNILKDEFIVCVVYVENYFNYLIVIFILKVYGEEIIKDKIKGYEEILGYGVKVFFEGKEVFVGNYKLMDKENIFYNVVEIIGIVVYIVINKKYVGYIIIFDEVKSDLKSVIRVLKEIGVKKIIMFIGDNKVVGSEIVKELGLDEVYVELLLD